MITCICLAQVVTLLLSVQVCCCCPVPLTVHLPACVLDWLPAGSKKEELKSLEERVDAKRREVAELEQKVRQGCRVALRREAEGLGAEVAGSGTGGGLAVVTFYTHSMNVSRVTACPCLAPGMQQPGLPMRNGARGFAQPQLAAE